MTTSDTRGVTALAQLLEAVASGTELRVAEFVAANGIARSSAFEIARRAETAGFIRRDTNGALQPGRELVRFAFAAHGIGSMFGPAEPLCAALRDETGHDVGLWSRGTPRVLLLFLPGFDWKRGGQALEQPVGIGPRAWLTLETPSVFEATAAATHAMRALRRTAQALEHYITPVFTPREPSS